MPRTFTYKLNDYPASMLTIVTADSLTAVQASSANYQGYAVLSVAGSFEGRTITGLLGTGGSVGSSTLFGAYDNAIVPYGVAAPGGERYGVDGQGIAFTVAQTDPSEQGSYKLTFFGDNFGVGVTADGTNPILTDNNESSSVVTSTTGDPGGSEVYYIDGSTGTQRFSGHADTNFIVTTEAAGTGPVEVSLTNTAPATTGTVTRSGQVDAAFTNIQGVVAGADTTIVHGTEGFPYTENDLVYGGSGHLEYDAAYRSGASIQGSTTSSYIVGSDSGAQGAGTLLFCGHGSTDVMMAGSGINTMVCNADPTSTSLFGGLQQEYAFDAAGVEQDYIYGQGGTVTVFGGVASQVLCGGSGTNTMVGTNTVFSEFPGATDPRAIHEGTNVFYGGTGVDAGTDIFYAGIGVNLMYEGSGTDTFVGGAGIDHITGGAGRSFIYGGTGDQFIDTGAGDQYLRAGTGNTVFNETAADQTTGRVDWIDDFEVASGATGGKGTFLNLAKAAHAETTFQAQNGGTLILTPATSGSGQAALFVSHTAASSVEAQTFSHSRAVSPDADSVEIPMMLEL